MSDVVLHHSLPVSGGRHLDLSQPPSLPEGSTPHGGHGLLGDQQMFVKRYSSAASPLSPLDVSAFLYNLQSISSSTTPHPLTPDPLARALTYDLQGEKEARLRLSAACQDLSGAEWKASASHADQHDARFRKKRALPFGGDPPGSVSPSLIVPGFPESLSPVDDLQFSLGKLPCYEPKSVKKKAQGFITNREGKVRELTEKEDCGEGGQWAELSMDSVGLLGPGSPDLLKKLGQPSCSSPLMLPHSIPFSPSDPISQTLRDLSKIVHARERRTGGVGDAKVPHLLSSSSSSSSSTCSSLHKVGGEEGERQSQSSTPTNLSASPSADEGQSLPAPLPTSSSQTIADLPSVTPGPNTDRRPKAALLQTSTDFSQQCDAVSNSRQVESCEEQPVLDSCQGSHTPSSLPTHRIHHQTDHTHNVEDTHSLTYSSTELLPVCPPVEKLFHSHCLDSRGRAEDERKSLCTFYLEPSAPSQPSSSEESSSLLVSAMDQLRVETDMDDFSVCCKETSGSLSNSGVEGEVSQGVPGVCSNGYTAKDAGHTNGFGGEEVLPSCVDTSPACGLVSGASCVADSVQSSSSVCGRSISSIDRSCQSQLISSGETCTTYSENKPHSFSNTDPRKIHEPPQTPSPEEEDSVFIDKVKGMEAKVSRSSHSPIRTKSAPSFSSMAGLEVGQDEGLTSEEVRRGRSAVRDKVSGCVSWFCLFVM